MANLIPTFVMLCDVAHPRIAMNTYYVIQTHENTIYAFRSVDSDVAQCCEISKSTDCLHVLVLDR